MTSPARKARRLAVLTNILAPYRLPIYHRLAEHFDLTVLYSGHEPNRSQWNGLAAGLARMQVKHSFGIAIPWLKRDQQAVLDSRYLHVNPGFFTDLLKLRPDAVISDELGFRTVMALLYAKLFAKPLWVWWGGTLHTERGIGLGRRLLRRQLAGIVRGWFSYGATSTEYLESLGVPRSSIVELQNCVFEGPYVGSTSPAVALDVRPVLLCVSRLVPGKGVDLLLEAAACLQGDGLQFSLLLVGEGPELPRLEEKVQELELRNVVFFPPQSPDRVPTLYRSADVLVFPTLDDVWGLVVNEALWSGLPALVSIYAGCARELVPSSSTFDPLDAADFAAKLRLAVNRQLPPPDLTRLKRIDEVSDLIIREVQETRSQA
jgi:glycosyltransferase involved in cell wall biosynthesis